MATPVLSQDYVRSLFDYDPLTGNLIWKVRSQSDFKTKRAWSIINSRHVGSTLKPTSRGYVTVGINGARYRAHRIIWLYVYGETPLGEVDHINGDPSDNRLENLRLVTSQENSRNMKTPKNNSSGAIGVSYRHQKKSWRAYITVNNRQKHLGHFPTREAAIAARLEGAMRLGFHQNHGR